MLAVVVRRTAFGFRVLAIAATSRPAGWRGCRCAAPSSGVYAISGFLAAVAGLIVTMRLRAADPSYVGLNIELTAITAVVVGGSLLTAARCASSARSRARCSSSCWRTPSPRRTSPTRSPGSSRALIIIAAVFIQRPSRSAR